MTQFSDVEDPELAGETQPLYPTIAPTHMKELCPQLYWKPWFQMTCLRRGRQRQVEQENGSNSSTPPFSKDGSPRDPHVPQAQGALLELLDDKKHAKETSNGTDTITTH